MENKKEVKWVVVTDIEVEAYDTKEKALEEAERAWSYKTKYDKKRTEIFMVASLEMECDIDSGKWRIPEECTTFEFIDVAKDFMQG